jgi:hypothetical protein
VLVAAGRLIAVGAPEAGWRNRCSRPCWAARCRWRKPDHAPADARS